MQKLSVLLFSRNDTRQAVGLIKDIYDIADDIVLLDSSGKADRKTLAEQTKGMKKLRAFYVVAMGYPDPMLMYSIGKCRNDWILRVDMDERMSAGLKKNINTIINKAHCSAFAIKRYEEVRHGERTDLFTWQIRLFRKNRVSFRGLIHEQADVNGRLEQFDDKEMYLEHVSELMHPGSDVQYSKMQKYERFSYRLYNKKLLDYISKLRMSGHRDASRTKLGMFVNVVLFLYEKITFRDMDREVSNFDYFVLQYLRNLTYQLKAGSVVGVFKALPETLKYVSMMREWRSAPDGDENFRIAKIINDIGITKFLHLDKDSTIQKINKKYGNEKQGVTLMFRLLHDGYREWLGKASASG